MQIWECKIVVPDDVELPDNADQPMRAAAEAALKGLTGREPEIIFSGWGGTLTSYEWECLK